MASSGVPVVDILDDDDDDVAAVASPPSSRKRSLPVTTSSSPDFLDAFSPSPPLQKRLLLAASAIVLDDTPSPPKRRPSSAPEPPVLVVDDDTDPSPAPCSLVPGDYVDETPDSVLPCSARFRSDFSETPGSAEPCSIDLDIVVVETPGFTSPRSIGPPAAHGSSSAAPAQKLSGVSSLISLDSDDESDDTIHTESLTKLPSNTTGTTSYGQPLYADLPREDSTLPGADVCTETCSPWEVKKRQKEEEKEKQQEEKRLKKEMKAKLIEERKQKQQEEKRLKKEMKAKLIEERKQNQQENKMQKEAMKAQLAEEKKKEKEVMKWESGKFALKCITAEIDSSIVESGSVGGQLLSSFAEKDLSYRVTANSTRGSILWKMKVPDDIAQNQAAVSEEVPYIVIFLQAEEFCDLVSSELLFNHIQKVRNDYPKFTICYVTNKLMSYINKREQSQYKNQSSFSTWRRPPVEKVLCKLATHYVNVHSRQCIDEAEVAEHLVGLTANLAKCKFRKPLTWLSVHANGAIIPKGFIDKGLAKKDTWLKALIAIPGIQPRYALAIWKEYRSMRSLLNVYMDPSKTVLEKELLLSDLKWEDRLGNEGKRLGQKCSRRVYRILMAQNGELDTDSPEAGA
ncbi:crossover junction endonuclease EME1 [Phragmites australis]|uniref:crossover junction endonuclease EME1 n=1 Tax=Phragmites australis TaxID=29695 RepID=UPI002D76BFEE|nr:crossover junction endonuclease EME1 [Phragmites australis]